MGDRSNSELYTMLLSFLEQRGQSLQSEGCAEHGLSYPDAVEFIALLERNLVPVLGFDVWRRMGARYSIDHTAIWYSPVPGVREDYVSALAALSRTAPGAEDVVAIQFR